MSLFKKPLVEVREVPVGEGEVLLLSPPTAFNYREYIRKLKAVYEDENKLAQLDDINIGLEGEVSADVVAKLHYAQDQNEDVTLHQIVCCAIGNYPDEGDPANKWDNFFKELKTNAHQVLFTAVKPHINEFLKLDQIQDEAKVSEAEKKPDSQTDDSPTG